MRRALAAILVLVGTLAATLACTLAGTVVGTSAQTAPQAEGARPTFTVASIKERDAQSTNNVVVGLQITPGRIVDECANLWALVTFAYNLPPFTRPQGLPDWGSGGACGPGNHANTYEFEATMPPDATRDQIRLMMQALLADRFKLTAHWETKDTSVYALVIGKGGFKLKPADPNAPPKYGSSMHCPDDDPHCHIVPLADGPLSVLASYLGGFLGRPVVDKTGLTDKYDISLEWASDNAENSSLPTLPTLLSEKFGLELKAETAPIQTLSIDHAEKPTPN